jgi:nitrous oxide reductase accessory protein NosL
MDRRHFLCAVPFAILACSRKEARCEFCGMKLDPASPWAAEVVGDGGVVHHFDSPKCALLAWRSGRVHGTGARLQEFYDRTWKSADQLVFALGSDVVGPMGADAVPVDPARAAKFASDHHAAKMAKLDELTQEVLEAQ